MKVEKDGNKTVFKCGKRFEPKKAARKKAEPVKEEATGFDNTEVNDNGY